MTVLNDFDSRKMLQPAVRLDVGPQVSSVQEAYWGLTIDPRRELDAGALIVRAVLLLMAGGAILAAVAVWLMPVSVIGLAGPVAKLVATALLIGSAYLAFRGGCRGHAVGVEIDTRFGEVRQVTRDLMGRVEVLSVHGFDTIRAVESVEADREDGFGQILIRTQTGEDIPAGEGKAFPLNALKARLTAAIGCEPARESVAAEHFTGWAA